MSSSNTAEKESGNETSLCSTSIGGCRSLPVRWIHRDFCEPVLALCIDVSLVSVPVPADPNPGRDGSEEEAPTVSSHRRSRNSRSCPSSKSARLSSTKGEPTGRHRVWGKMSLLFEKVMENLLDVVVEFQQGICATHFKDGNLAARNGYLYIVQHVAITFSEQAMVSAAAHGHLTMVKYLHRKRTEGATVQAMDLAATFGHLDVVKWLHDNRKEGCTTKAMDGAASNGHVQVLAFLKESRCEGGSDSAVDSAAANGHLGTVHWITTNIPGLAASKRAMDDAASEGHLDVVRFLHEARREGCTTNAMDSAARKGHLKVVEFLHKNRTEGCTSAAMDNAASGGHLEVLKFLAANRNEGCTVFAMNMAAWRGHLGVVEWLHNHRHEGCTTSAMNGAAYNGHLEVVKWLHENRTEGCNFCAMDVTAMYGHLEVLQWLHEHRSEGCTTNAMDWAAREGHLVRTLEAFEWRKSVYDGTCYKLLPYPPQVSGCNQSCRRFHSFTEHVVKWLHEKRTEGCTQAAVDGAAGNGHLEVLRFLIDRRRLGHSLRALDWATKNGHTDIVKALNEILVEPG